MYILYTNKLREPFSKKSVCSMQNELFAVNFQKVSSFRRCHAKHVTFVDFGCRLLSRPMGLNSPCLSEFHFSYFIVLRYPSGVLRDLIT